MADYKVVISPYAYRDLEGIYAYVAENLQAPKTAENLLNELEQAIFQLEEMPNRGAPRRRGLYADRGYRQLFVKNYTVVYRVDEDAKIVIIVTVKYSRRAF